MRIKNLILSIVSLALVFSCAREGCASDPAEREPTFRIVHYSAEVSEAVTTKATVDGGNQYIFEEGDRLYVAGTGENAEKLYGFLHLITGAGATTAHFEGDLYCIDNDEEFELTSSTPVSVTLVSSNDQIHSVSGGKITDTEYPDDECAADFADAVSKFSDFTGSGTFGSRSFTLSQQSSFLIFHVRMKAEEEAPEDRVITAKLYSDVNSISTLLKTADITVSEAGSVPFVLAFKGGEVSLDNAILHLEWTDSEEENQSRDFDVSNQTLAANNYYTISRTTIERRYGGFRIIALADGTITSSNIASLQYSLDEGENWQNYTTGIIVQNGDEVCFRANAANTVNSKKISSSANFAIAGDIVSLLIGAAYEEQPSPSIPNSYTFVNLFTDCTQLLDASGLVISMPSIPTSAFKSFFEGCTNLVAGPAELSSTTLGSTCYRNMFVGCSSLTSAPIIQSATTHNKSNNVGGWYQRMFFGCSSLQSIVFLDDVTYNSQDFTDWVNGVNANGTFYVSDTENNPFGANRGNSAIPSNWTISNYVEPTP